MQALPGTTTAPECEFCWHKAVVDVEGQWSIFDYDYVQCCALHVHTGVKFLQRRWVDNFPIREISFLWYEDLPF